ncbi:MAG: hypothetical protein LC799_08470 [Actinobacteria bacterium]|nr:hypothetical protein [Actinomycetota bacterium]
MSGPRCWPLPLPAAELAEWIALRRVRGGGVASLGGWWLDFGRPVPSYLDDPLDDVVRVGLVVLVEVPAHCLSRAVLTEDGSARYHTLCERRGIPLAARDPVSSGLPTGIPARWSGPDPVPSSPGIRRRHGATPGQAAS